MTMIGKGYGLDAVMEALGGNAPTGIGLFSLRFDCSSAPACEGAVGSNSRTRQRLSRFQVNSNERGYPQRSPASPVVKCRFSPRPVPIPAFQEDATRARTFSTSNKLGGSAMGRSSFDASTVAPSSQDEVDGDAERYANSYSNSRIACGRADGNAHRHSNC